MSDTATPSLPATLSPLDTAFLRLEGPNTSLHVASVAIFDGPAPEYSDIAEMITSKLPRVPRYTQRLQVAPLWLGRPRWVPDPEFTLDYHLRHTALPRPGSDAQLRETVGRLMSQQLDRTKPLWECWIIEGLARGRWAMVSKVHHCVVDGIAGADLMGVILDHEPHPTRATLPAEGGVNGANAASAQPGVLARAADGASVLSRGAFGAVRTVAGGVRHPERVGQAARTVVRGLAGFAELAGPAASTSLTGELGSPRVWTHTALRLTDVRKVRRRFGGTVNDVVLSLVAGGLRDLLIARGETPDERGLRALIPVSVRTTDERGRTDNRVSAMVAELPVAIADPVERLAAVRRHMDHLKGSGERQAGQLVTRIAAIVPPAVIAFGLSGLFRLPQWFVATVATNVPGPAQPLYAAGRRMRELYPYVPIADRLRVGVAIMSYQGVLGVGITGDRDSSPDVDVLAAGIETALRALVQAAA